MAALHVVSKLSAAPFDRKWRALPSSAAVFDAAATAGQTWLSYVRTGGAPQRWQWPFFHAADDAELARLLVELARVTRADEEPSQAGRFLQAAVAWAEADAPPLAFRAPPASEDELEDARAAINLDEWLEAHVGGDDLVEARDAVRAAAGGDLRRLQEMRARDLSRALPLFEWDPAPRQAFLAAARALRDGELGIEDECKWLDDVVELAGGAAEDTTVFLARDEADESFRDAIVARGVIVSLGGGIDVIVDLLAERGLLSAETPIAAILYFDTDGAALSTAECGYPTDAAVPLEIPDAWKGFARGDVRQLLDPARRAEILGGRPVAFLLNTPSCKPHAAVVVNRGASIKLPRRVSAVDATPVVPTHGSICAQVKRHEADMEELEAFLEAQMALVADTAAALEAAGAPAAQRALAVGEFGDAPSHVAALIHAKLGRPTFRLNAATVSAQSRVRTFVSTFPQRPVAANDQRRPVWKSNFGRPTPSTRRHEDSRVDFHTGGAACRRARCSTPTSTSTATASSCRRGGEGTSCTTRTRARRGRPAPPRRPKAARSRPRSRPRSRRRTAASTSPRRRPPPAATPSGTCWTSRRPRSSWATATTASCARPASRTTSRRRGASSATRSSAPPSSTCVRRSSTASRSCATRRPTTSRGPRAAPPHPARVSPSFRTPTST